MSKILEVKDLYAGYGKGKKYSDILKSVSFDMEQGEILGLAGESGSGKSTIARTLLGVTTVKSGHLKKDYKQVRMVFQDPFMSLNPSMTVERLLTEVLVLWKKRLCKEVKNTSGDSAEINEKKKTISELSDKEKCHKRILDVLDMVELDEALLVRKPNELSGGQRQRVSIAMALISEPDFLIADEPVSALDVTIQAQILEMLLKIKKQKNLSIIFISHDLRTMYNICDRIVILKDGEIKEIGEPKVMYRNPQSDYCKLLLESAGISIN